MSGKSLLPGNMWLTWDLRLVLDVQLGVKELKLDDRVTLAARLGEWSSVVAKLLLQSSEYLD